MRLTITLSLVVLVLSCSGYPVEVLPSEDSLRTVSSSGDSINCNLLIENILCMIREHRSYSGPVDESNRSTEEYYNRPWSYCTITLRGRIEKGVFRAELLGHRLEIKLSEDCKKLGLLSYEFMEQKEENSYYIHRDESRRLSIGLENLEMEWVQGKTRVYSSKGIATIEHIKLLEWAEDISEVMGLGGQYSNRENRKILQVLEGLSTSRIRVEMDGITCVSQDHEVDRGSRYRYNDPR